MQAMGINKVINFPFPTAPTVDALNVRKWMMDSVCLAKRVTNISHIDVFSSSIII